MKVHADTIALLLMLGDNFTEWEAYEASKEAGISANVIYLMMQGWVKNTGELRPVKGRPPVSTFVVTELGKEQLL